MAVEQCARSKTPALILLAAACVDESDHLTLVNAGDEEVVSQEEGGREGSAAGGEEGGCCCASAIAIAHMRTHRARENSTRLGRVALTGGPVCV